MLYYFYSVEELGHIFSLIAKLVLGGGNREYWLDNVNYIVDAAYEYAGERNISALERWLTLPSIQLEEKFMSGFQSSVQAVKDRELKQDKTEEDQKKIARSKKVRKAAKTCEEDPLRYKSDEFVVDSDFTDDEGTVMLVYLLLRKTNSVTAPIPAPAGVDKAN
jgi:hypothetical protein